MSYAEDYERRQRHLAPLQEDPEWKEWLADHEIGLAHFFANVVPDMPADPYTREGLLHAEAAALRMFSDMDAADPDRTPPEANLIIDPFQRYIGEVFVRTFEGRWIYADANPSYGPEPSVDLPYGIVPLVVRTTLTMIAHRRTGDQLAWIFDQQQETYGWWVEAGRPPYPDFAEIDERRFEEELERP